MSTITTPSAFLEGYSANPSLKRKFCPNAPFKLCATLVRYVIFYRRQRAKRPLALP